MEKCSYCGKEGDKLKKVGPDLKYCNNDCFYNDCIERHPGTSLANIVERIIKEGQPWKITKRKI